MAINDKSVLDTPQDTDTASQRAARPGILARIRAVLTPGHDTSLRESLEDVIEQHDSAQRDFSPEEHSMLLNILGFGKKRIEDVMVPRADITGIDQSATISELMATFKSAGHSRLPVYRETLDDLVGMVHIKDVMGWLTAVALKPVKSKTTKPGGSNAEPKLQLADVNLSKTLFQVRLHREVLFVPPSMLAMDLLVKMQTTRIHLAIVVDEYGGTDGLVSIEDLVEEIVGEIEDEHDIEDGPLIMEDGPSAYIADARVLLDDLISSAGLAVLSEHDDDIDTLGGLVFSLVGRVPVRGELILHRSGVEFEILEADPRRLKMVRIHLKPSARHAKVPAGPSGASEAKDAKPVKPAKEQAP